MDSLYIVLPAYNEAENISGVIREWYPVIQKHHGNGASRIVVVNDGSTDDTLSILQGLRKNYPKLIVLDQQNKGHGATVCRAYRYALDAAADYIFQTDSDGQTSPEDFEAFWEQRECADVVIGNRTHREDGFMRIFVTNVLKLVIFLVFGVVAKDANTPFRLMKHEFLEKRLKEVPDGFYLPNILLTVLSLYHLDRVRFLPITFRKRQGGANSILFRHILRIGFQAIKDFCKIRRKLSQGRVQR